MRLSPKKWPDQQGNDHWIVNVAFDEADVLRAQETARAKVKHVNVHSPGGIHRTQTVIENRITAGKLADLAVLSLIKRSIEKFNLKDRFSAFEYDAQRTDNYRDPDPYDLLLTDSSNSQKSAIEVRSSFCYMLPDPILIINKLSIYGWYTSANKAVEPPKDWYWQVIFHSRPEDIPEPNRVAVPIPVFEQTLRDFSTTCIVVGGSTHAALKANGVVRSDQDKASYQSIFPISKGLDVKQMLDGMLERNPTQ